MAEDKSASTMVASPLIEFSHCPRQGRDAVDYLISVLSPWELLYLRNKAREIFTHPNLFATFADMPVDIILHIASFFSPRDLLHCRAVSRGWRQVWMHHAVLRHHLRAKFPGLMELHPHAKDLEQVFLRVHRSNTLGRAGRPSKFVPWMLSTTSSKADTHRVADRGTVQTLSTAPVVKYHGGKVAWQIDRSSVWVDDLHSGRRMQCVLGTDATTTRQQPRLVAMSEDLVILAGIIGDTLEARSTRQLHVYHLQQRQWAQIGLPSELEKCYTQNDVIAAVCDNGQMVVWKWAEFGYELPLMDAGSNLSLSTGSSARLVDAPGVLFHPTDHEIYFLVFSYAHHAIADTELHTTVVVEYRHDRHEKTYKLVRRYENSLANPATESKHPEHVPYTLPDEGICVQQVCERANAHGLFALSWLGCSLHCLQGYLCPCYRDSLLDRGYWTSICFNVLTRSFTTLGFASGHNLSKQFKKQQWNFNLYEQWYPHVVSDGYRGERPIVYSYPACVGKEQWVPNPVGTGNAYTFEPFERFPELAGGPHEMFVDDEYTVQVARNGYVVQSCGQSAPEHGMPSVESYERDPSREQPVEVSAVEATSSRMIVYVPSHQE